MQPASSLSLEDVCSRLGLSVDAVVEISQQPRPYYAKFERRKRAGGVRTISASQGRLKSIQRAFLDGILSQFSMPPHVHGCVKGRSAMSNAQIHVDRDIVINVDISDFFGSVSLHMVTELLIKELGLDEPAAVTFANLMVLDGVLPQGAPTSPTLANLAALNLDNELIDLCRRSVGDAFRYSRYVDDITISGPAELASLLPDIYQSIEHNGFFPNIAKTRILKRSTRQSVTGVVVNKTVSVPKTLIRKIRQQIYYCQKWGLKEHCETRGIKPESFLKWIRGSIGYIGTVRPELASEFSIAVDSIAAHFGETREEYYLRAFKRIIDNGDVVSFVYERDRHLVVAPASIVADPDETLLVRAFQLRPEQGWKFFAVSEISDLRIEPS